MKDFSVVSFAHEILDMEQTIRWQRKEIARLQHIEQDFNELLTSSLSYSRDMMLNLVGVMSAPGVIEAVKNSPFSMDLITQGAHPPEKKLKR